MKFHDGSEMTSRDVKATYDKIIFPPAGVALLPQGRRTRASRRSRPRTRTRSGFRLKWAEDSFLLNLASPWNWIYKADILAKDIRWYEKNIMGTGPSCSWST